MIDVDHQTYEALARFGGVLHAEPDDETSAIRDGWVELRDRTNDRTVQLKVAPGSRPGLLDLRQAQWATPLDAEPPPNPPIA